MSDENIAAVILGRAAQHGQKRALAHTGADYAEDYSYQALIDRSAALADWLIDVGIAPGDRICLLCESRPRWGVVFFAASQAGAVLLPLDCRLSVSELRTIIEDAEPRVLLVSRAMEQVGRQLVAAVPIIEHLISVEPPEKSAELSSIDILRSSKKHASVERSGDDIAVLTYTSGTTAAPKGVATTHANLLFQVDAYCKLMRIDSDNVCVSVLPLNHLFEFVAGFLCVLYAGGSVWYCNSLMPHDVRQAMCERQATCMMTVPLFLKLLASEASRQTRLRSAVGRLSFALKLQLAGLLPVSLRRSIFRDIHAEFGGRLRYFVSGGAPIEDRIYDFFWRLGFPIYQGYGMAEASPVIATNDLKQCRAGSVGKPLPGVEVKISDVDESGTGEILTRGPHVMREYFRDPISTQQVIDSDGWLHTGDLGHLDRRGYLFIVGRKKNLIVLGSGKNVYPEELEDVISAHPDIREGCVLGVEARSGLLAGTEEVCAVVVPSDGVIEQNADNNKLVSLMRAAVSDQCRNLAPYKRPTRIVVSRQCLPRTATRKVRRSAVIDWLRSQEERPL